MARHTNAAADMRARYTEVIGERLCVSHSLVDAMLAALDEEMTQLCAERDDLKAAVERTRALHRKFREDIAVCDHCDDDYPCLTIRTLETLETSANTKETP